MTLLNESVTFVYSLVFPQMLFFCFFFGLVKYIYLAHSHFLSFCHYLVFFKYIFYWSIIDMQYYIQVYNIVIWQLYTSLNAHPK